MERSIRKRNSVTASTNKPFGKPLPMDKTIGLETSIGLYEIEEGDKTEEGEDAEILIIHDKILAATKQKVFKRKFPYINMFNHQGLAVVCVMLNLTSGVFEHLETTAHMYVYKRVNYMQRLLRGAALKKYNDFLTGCKESAEGLAGDHWTLGEIEDITME